MISSDLGIIRLENDLRFTKSKEDAMKANQEKKDIYEPCVTYFKQNYNVESIEVIGLLVGARGTITKHNMKEFKIKFNLPKKIFEEIVVSILIKRFNENNELPFIPSKKKMTFKHR
uniref:Uncharacterized protein n=1 Tax=Cacopsylla melanoneura TaxID=428564 RepID=A0A8D8WY07_9HEMI